MIHRQAPVATPKLGRGKRRNAHAQPPIAFRFNYDDVRTSEAVARLAVLFPVAAALGRPTADAAEAAQVVLDAWRSAIASRLLPGTSFTVNGRPWGVKFAEFARTTCKSAICPWCHGRAASALASAVGLDAPGLFAKRAADRHATLLENRQYLGDPEKVPGAVDEWTQEFRAYSFAFGNVGDAVYWAVQTDVDSDPAGRPGWVVKARLLAIHPADSRTSWGSSFCEWEGPVTSQAFTELLARATAYPAGLLVDPSRAEVAVHARGGRRLTERRGWFRKSTS